MSAAALPYIPRPFLNELMNSWLNRIACNYGVNWDDFPVVQEHGIAELPDFAVRREEKAILAELTGADLDIVAGLDLLSAFPGALRDWLVLADGGRAVASYCPDCLKEDAEHGNDAYLRQEWAVAGVGHCHRHGKLLWSRCHHCTDDIAYLWRVAGTGVGLFCRHCALRLGGGPIPHREPWRNQNLRFAVLEAETLILATVRRQDPWYGPADYGWVFLSALEDLAYFICRETPTSFWGPAASSQPVTWLAAVIPGINSRHPSIHTKRHPLRNPDPGIRAWLVAAALHMLFSEHFVTEADAVIFGFRPSLAWLAETLGDTDSRSLMRNARYWSRLMEQSPFFCAA